MLRLSYRQCSTKAEVKSPAITISYTNKNGQLLVGSLLICGAFGGGEVTRQHYFFLKASRTRETRPTGCYL